MSDPGIENALRRLAGGDDAAVDLAEAALLLAAREHPGVPLDRYRQHLDELVCEVARTHDALPDSASRKADALAVAVHDRFAYTGDRATYDDLQNTNLVRVIDRRKGLPIALGILHIHCGRALGWDICGLSFPGHFLVRLDDGPERTILDPFNDGVEVTPAELRDLLKATHGADAELSPAHYAAASNREILIRLQNNRKIRLLQANRIAEGLTTVEDMLLFAPGEAALWYEAGTLNAHLGNLRAALIALDHARDLTRDPGEQARIGARIAELRGRLN